jgi:hypothetical protein
MAEFAQHAQAIGTVLSVVGQAKAGSDTARAAEFQAAQLDQNAGQYRAAAQRSAEEARRQARLAGSRVQALARGGGGDESIVRLQGEIAGEGELRALTAMYEGEERARGAEMQAAGRRFEGKNARRAANLGALNTVVKFGPGLYEKYFKAGDPYGLGDRDKWGRE